MPPRAAAIVRPVQVRAVPGLPQRFASGTSGHDAAEAEAHATARRVMQAPAGAVTRAATGAQRAEASPATAPPAKAASPLSAPPAASGGAALPAGVRGFMEERFNADFGAVRVHADDSAARKAAEMNSRAVTIGPDIYFGRDEFRPENASSRELIAHELTHVIQQGAAVQRPQGTPVAQRSPVRPQRLGLPNPLDWVAEKANYIPGFRLLTIALGVNPINFAAVRADGPTILRALMELIPVTGPMLVAALDRYGIIDKVGTWFEVKVRALGMAAAGIKAALDAFIKSLGWKDVADLEGAWERAKRIFTEPIDRLIAFGRNTVVEILEFVRDAILVPLAALAEGTRGYPLLKVLLGKDPITGAKVERTPDALVGGFMTFIGEQEIWENVKKANAIPRVWAWFQGAMQTVLAFAHQVPPTFTNALKSLGLADLILPPLAFAKVAVAFAPLAQQFFSWAAGAMWTILEIVFEVVSPQTLAYLKQTGAALKSILKNPLPFVRNLVAAAKLGFDYFATNFLEHLKTRLIDWLVGSLPGVYIPKAFTLSEMAKFLFSVLGLTWANIRPKLVKVLTEPVVSAMETGFDIVVTLVTQGPAAAWEKIQEQMVALKDQAIGAVTDMVVGAVVKKAIPKLIAMFIPGAGFVSAIVSIYDTIKTIIEKVGQIAAVVKGFVDSIVAIAAGQIESAAKRVEMTLANALSLAINVLFGFLGLGDIAGQVMGAINKIRATVDRAVDALIAWIVKMAKTLFAKGKAAVGKLISWWNTKTQFRAGGESHSLYFQGEGPQAKLIVASDALPVEVFLKEKEPAAKGDPVKEEAIKAVRSLLKEVNDLTPDTASQEKKAEDATLQKKIEGLMNQMGEHLVKLLSDHEWGTEDNPCAFDYQKRRAEAYPTFYLATGKLVSQGQAEMQKQFAGQAANGTGDRVFRYRPMETTEVPDKSAKLGLGAASQIDVGKKLLFEDKEDRGGGVSRFKNLVAKFGFVASESGWDVDHVVELQIGGKDEFENMWPLPKGENRSSGSIIKSATIEVPGTKEKKPVKNALEEKKKGGKGQKPQTGLWLLIKTTRQL